MLVGTEKKIMGWRNDMLGPGKKRWLTPAMLTGRGYIDLLEFKETTDTVNCPVAMFGDTVN